jgi:hypothetical protein
MSNTRKLSISVEISSEEEVSDVEMSEIILAATTALSVEAAKKGKKLDKLVIISPK